MSGESCGFVLMSSGVRSLEGDVGDRFGVLGQLSAGKRLVLDDHLARETFNEKLRLEDGQHVIVCGTIDGYCVMNVCEKMLCVW